MHRSLVSLFPPPPKPARKNFILENIKQIQHSQIQNKQENLKNGSSIKSKQIMSRAVPKFSNGLINGSDCESGKRPVSSMKRTKTLPDIPVSSRSNSSHGYSKKPIPGSPKYKDVECQYLESDSRYYFADGSTIYFIYPSENRQAISSHANKSDRKNSLHLRTTESCRRKHSNKALLKKKNALQDKLMRRDKDADTQCCESDFIDNTLPEDNLGPSKSVTELDNHEHIEADIPRLNLKDFDNLDDGNSCMASIIEAGRSKTQETLRSNAESESSVTVVRNLQNGNDPSIVPMVDIQQELNEIMNNGDKAPSSNDELMKKLKYQFSKKVNELNHMPMRSDTLRARTRKIQLEKELTELEKNIKMLSYPKAKVDIRAIS